MFNTKDISDLHGKTVLITGGNSGIGFQTAKELLCKGAEVFITCRNAKNIEVTARELRKACPEANLHILPLDLASLESIRTFHERFTIPKLDILINNAGVMNIPKHTLTEDGFERHMGTNHLGHFALTLSLLPKLRKATAPRVVTMSALVAYSAKLDFENLQSEKSYRPMSAYAQSKLCNVLFANELGRLEPGITSVAVQPGSAMTKLQRHTPKKFEGIASFFMNIVGQKVEDCALPSLYAATNPDVKNGEFFGPAGKFNKGGAKKRRMPKKATDALLARKIWTISEKLTSTYYAKESPKKQSC